MSEDNIENKPYPGIKNAIFLCLLLLGFQIVVGIIPWIITAIFEIDTESILYEIGTVLLHLLAFGLVIFIGYKKSHKKFGELFVFKNVSWSLWIAITVFMVGFVILISELDNIIEYFLPMPELVQKVFESMVGNKYIIMAVLSVGIIPPFVEELLFRGVILNGFKENYSHKKAIIISSLLFGIMHFNPWQFVTAFIFGMISAWVCLKIKTLSTSIYMHMFNNMTGVLVMKYRDIITIEGFNSAYSEQAFQPLWFDITGIILTSIGIILFFNEIRDAKKMVNQ